MDRPMASLRTGAYARHRACLRRSTAVDPASVHRAAQLLALALLPSWLAGGLAQSRPELGPSFGPGQTRFVFCPKTVSAAANGVFLPHRCPLEPFAQQG